MPQSRPRFRPSSVIPSAIALVLAMGWATREMANVFDHAPALGSQTINLDQVKMSVFKDGDNPVGKIGLYVQGESPGCSSLVTGRFVIDPGKSPHAPHVHADEEVLIVESGHGEIICDGKTTKVGPGSVMYSTPNVAHGINNTDQEPLTFYFVKWVPKGSSEAR